jgi:hypothetical protein
MTMISTKDIYWLAGLIEGEGCFHLDTIRGTPVPTIRVKMTDLDVVNRAAAILRSGLKSPGVYSYPDKSCLGTKQAWSARLGGYRAAGWMMTLYPLMGERRQRKIREILEAWKVFKGGRRSSRAHFLRNTKKAMA